MIMADAILSVAVKRVAAIIEELLANEINLVRGAEEEARSLSNVLMMIRNALDNAESRRFKDKSLNNWLSKLEHIAYEIEDVLDEWSFTLLKLQKEPKQEKVRSSFIPSSSSCLPFKKVSSRRDIAIKIKDVKGKFDKLLKEKNMYESLLFHPNDRFDFVKSRSESWRVQSIPEIDLAEIHGRISEKDILVGKLVSNSVGHGESGFHVLSIVGVGGLGKTTLAQLVYNDSRVKESFDLRIWICVSDPFNVVAVFKGILESVKVGSSRDTDELSILSKRLIEMMSGNKFFLVLDDVWSKDDKKWEPLKNTLRYGGAGSIVLVTTRNEDVAKVMGTNKNDIHRPLELSDEDCWLLMSDVAFGRNKENHEKFEGVGREIAKMCKGLPLAAKTLGSLLGSKNTLEEWEDVLKSEIWELKNAEVDLFPHLLLSYNELSPTLKRCFSYCAIFRKDTKIEVEDLIRMWMAKGYLGINILGNDGDLEREGRYNFTILAKHSLFQDFKKDDMGENIVSFKMHDIVHDFAQFVRNNSKVDEAIGMQKPTCQVCDPLLVSSVKKYRSLLHNCFEPPPKLCDCLRSLRILRMACCCHLECIPQGMEKLIHLRWLDLSYNELSSGEGTKSIYKLYNLQFLWLSTCGLREISSDIGNLIHLRHLDVSKNFGIKELPESICSLNELRTLNVDSCSNLRGLPEGIDRLVNLKHLHNEGTWDLKQYPQGLAQLSGLRTLSEFRGGSGFSKLGWLKNLNRLTGSLKLEIILNDVDVVEDAREAELREKIHIRSLVFFFIDIRRGEKESSLIMDVIDALEPHPELLSLEISRFKGPKLPNWIASLNQLTYFTLSYSNNLSSMWPLGKLLCLEKIVIARMRELQYLGKEFLLGMTTTATTKGDESSSSSSTSAANTTTTIAFPKLKELEFRWCGNWKEWEDITVEEEEDSTTLSLLPCLTKLSIRDCDNLMALPHCLLRKLSSLETLDISFSTKLKERYGDKNGSDWRSISQIPNLKLGA